MNQVVSVNQCTQLLLFSIGLASCVTEGNKSRKATSMHTFPLIFLCLRVFFSPVCVLHL